MPASTARAAAPDGLLAARITPESPWEAIRALRNGMRAVRRAGSAPHVVFLEGVASDRRPRVSLLVLGYVAGRAAL